MVDLGELFESDDVESIGKYFSFAPGLPAAIHTRDGKMFSTKYYVCDAEMALPGIFLRTDGMLERLVFIPWSNISYMESIVLAEDE